MRRHESWSRCWCSRVGTVDHLSKTYRLTSDTARLHLDVDNRIRAVSRAATFGGAA
jgi:hypothetical protein